MPTLFPCSHSYCRLQSIAAHCVQYIVLRMPHVLVVASRRAAEEAMLVSCRFHSISAHCIWFDSCRFHSIAAHCMWCCGCHMWLLCCRCLLLHLVAPRTEEAMLGSWMIAECPQSLAAQNGVVLSELTREPRELVCG